MSINDEEFLKRLRATFAIEAEEHLRAISARLLELEKTTDGTQQAAALEEIHRAAHSLKGASRAVDLRDVEAICQALESVFSLWKRAGGAPSAENFDVLHGAVDAMRDFIFETGPAIPAHGARRDSIVGALNQMHLQPTAAQALVPIPADLSAESSSAEPLTPAAHAFEGSVPLDTVRIATVKLEKQVLEAEEMLALKGTLAQYALDLRELGSPFEPWHKQWAAVAAEARALRQQPTPEANAKQNDNGAHQAALDTTRLADFLDLNLDTIRSLEHKLSELAVRVERDRQVVGKLVDNLLEDSKKLLMLPFSILTHPFPKIVRDLCRDQGKEAELSIRGGEVEIDKRILDEMKDPLMHVLRNCVDHGVEKPEQRGRTTKSARAMIVISVAQVEGNKVEIVVADDGAGIDVARVRKSAIRQGVISAEEAQALTDAETLELIFRSGVSTSPMITEISGRGLGMTIVRAQAEKLGGHATLETTPGAGTRLRIVLPVALATFRGLLVRAGGALFVIPRNAVERVTRFANSEVQTVQNRDTLALGGRAVSLVRLDAVLGLAPARVEGPPRTHQEAIVIGMGEKRIAFVVEEVLHEEEVMVKPLRRPIIRARNIAGATVLGTGKAVPVLNVNDLLKSAMQGAVAATSAAAPAVKSHEPGKKLLVVEDSITSRMLLKGILESAGYRVRTAVDGVDAFTTLREDDFDLVVSDVEMPRMNGFELTGRIRADRRLAQLPVVLVTALESREERERGIDAGASAYVIKSSFDQSNLLEIVRRLI